MVDPTTYELLVLVRNELLNLQGMLTITHERCAGVVHDDLTERIASHALRAKTIYDGLGGALDALFERNLKDAEQRSALMLEAVAAGIELAKRHEKKGPP